MMKLTQTTTFQPHFIIIVNMLNTNMRIFQLYIIVSYKISEVKRRKFMNISLTTLYRQNFLEVKKRKDIFFDITLMPLQLTKKR